MKCNIDFELVDILKLIMDDENWDLLVRNFVPWKIPLILFAFMSLSDNPKALLISCCLGYLLCAVLFILNYFSVYLNVSFSQCQSNQKLHLLNCWYESLWQCRYLLVNLSIYILNFNSSFGFNTRYHN